METKRWGEPNFELYGKPLSDVHNVTSLDLDNGEPNQRRFPTVFVPKTVKQYKKIEGKRYRLPRKVKKRFKSKMSKACGIKGTKKLKFSYKRLNMIHNNHEIRYW